MLVQLTKWGNSLALRIPAAYAKEIGATANSKAELSVEKGRLVVKPLNEGPAYDLEELVSQITDQNRHEEIDTGPAVGREFR